MPKKTIIDRLLEEERLIKNARQTETTQVNTGVAESMAEQIFNQLYDEAIDAALRNSNN